MSANFSPSAGISAGTAAFNPNGASTVGAGETSGAGDGTEAHAGRVGNPLTQRCCPLCQRAFAGRPKKLLPPSAIAEYLAGDTVQQVADGLAAGVCSLWGAMAPPADLRAILVTAPNEGVLDVLLAGPDIEDVTPFFSRLDGIARSERCGSLRLIGPGFWKEVLPREWRPVFTVYERTLEPRQA